MMRHMGVARWLYETLLKTSAALKRPVLQHRTPELANVPASAPSVPGVSRIHQVGADRKKKCHREGSET